MLTWLRCSLAAGCAVSVLGILGIQTGARSSRPLTDARVEGIFKAWSTSRSPKRRSSRQSTAIGSSSADFGENRWDLIVLSYVTVRDIADRVVRALKPGGIVVVEAFHRDVTRERPVGGVVVFDSNELLNLFGKLRVLRYEDADATSDFGGAGSRAVRLCAMKEGSTL